MQQAQFLKDLVDSIFTGAEVAEGAQHCRCFHPWLDVPDSASKT